MTAPGSAGPRVSTQELENWERTGMLSDCAKDLLDDRRALASLRAQLAEMERERDEARRVIAWANNSLFGSHGFFLSLRGDQPNDEHHLDRAIEDLKAAARERHTLRAQNERLREALEAVEWGPAPLIEGHSACSWCLGVGKHSRACLVRRALASTDTGESRDA